MKKRIISLLVVCILIAVVFLGFFYKKTTDLEQHLTEGPLQNDYLVSPAIIDAINDVTHVSSMQPGTIENIYVKVGQEVKKGDKLFSLRSSLVKNAVKINELNLAKIKKEYQIAKTHVRYLKKQLRRLQSIDKRAISQVELQDKAQELKLAAARLLQTRDDLRLAKANLKNAQLTLGQFTTTARKDGIVLQINTHVNEYVGTSEPIIYLADANKVIVRVSIDERDISRFQKDATAYLINYNDSKLNIPLTFLQLDQYIVVQERLNSRVQEALYYFNRKDFPAYAAGHLFDVHIDAKTS